MDNERLDHADVIDVEAQVSTEHTMELQVLTHVQEFKWNFEEIKASVAGYMEKYIGLVVTDDNLRDMEAAQKECATVRVKLDSFRKEQKKIMELPIVKFENEVKELLELVKQAESPLKDQIQKYEDARIERRENEIQEFAKEQAGMRGLRDENFTQFVILPEWTRRTAKEASTNKAVIKTIDLLVEHQKNADEAKLLREQKTELIAKMCEIYSRTLKTTITPEDIVHLTKDATLPQIPEIIMNAATKRMELETTAAAAVEVTPPPVTVPAIPISGGYSEYDTWICSPNCPKMPSYGNECPDDLGPDPCPMGILTKEAPPAPPINSGPPLQPAVPACPPIYPGPLKQYEVLLKFNSISMSQAQEVIAFLAQRGISYNVISQVEIADPTFTQGAYEDDE
jgi:hypothetical protein